MNLNNQLGSWSAFQDWLDDHFQDGPAGGEEHWATNEDINLNEHDEVIELVQTGSVTTTVAGRKFEISLVVKEVT